MRPAGRGLATPDLEFGISFNGNQQKSARFSRNMKLEKFSEF
jgi:hypothetical protein